MQTVSVVIPVFNGMKTLGAAIESVLQQTYPVHEILVVDDGSTDGTATVAQSFAEEHPSVRYFPQKNSGVSSARNLGIQQASGEWIAFLDSDDTWDPRKLEKQLGEISKTPDVSASYTGMWVHNTIDGGVAPHPAKIYESLLDRLRYGNCGIGASSLMVRASVLREIGGFDPVFDAVEDWELAFRLLMRGKKILTVPEPLIHYTVALGSLSMSRKLLNQDLRLLSSGRLLFGLSGWRRCYWRQKILAEIFCRAGFTARTNGNSNEAALRFLQSVLSWPTENGLKALLVTGLRSLH